MAQTNIIVHFFLTNKSIWIKSLIFFKFSVTSRGHRSENFNVEKKLFCFLVEGISLWNVSKSCLKTYFANQTETLLRTWFCGQVTALQEFFSRKESILQDVLLLNTMIFVPIQWKYKDFLELFHIYILQSTIKGWLELDG